VEKTCTETDMVSRICAGWVSVVVYVLAVMVMLSVPNLSASVWFAFLPSRRPGYAGRPIGAQID
jgi:hypothetical protein